MPNLVTLQESKDFQGITDDASDDQLTLIIPMASYFLETECNRKFIEATYTEYHSGLGQVDLALRQRPVQSITSIHCDSQGYGGDNTAGFGSDTQITAGSHFMLVRDESGTTYSKSGLVRWLSDRAMFGGGAWPRLGSGMLTRGLGLARGGWPVGDGNIKVVYVAGWELADLPPDLTLACHLFIQTLKSQSDNNKFQPTGESIGPFSTQYGQLQYYAREVYGMRDIIRKYREVAV